MSQVQFFSADKKVNLINRKLFKISLLKIFKAERKKVRVLSIIFCSDNFLLEINQRHLNHDYYTDVITFEFYNQQNFLSGEVYISVERIKENAKVFLSSYQIELRRVIIHGVLHLCGFNDKTTKQRKLMRIKEDYYLEKFSREI